MRFVWRTNRRVQMLEHDERIDIASCWMLERFGNNAYDGEPKFPPEAHSAFVCGNNQVELHGAEACCQRNFLRVPAHGGGDTQPTCSGADDIAAIADVATWPRLIRLEVVGADQLTVRPITDEGSRRNLHPGMMRLLFGDFRRVGIRFPCAEHRFKNSPDLRPVGSAGFSDRNAHWLIIVAQRSSQLASRHKRSPEIEACTLPCG